MGAVVTAGCGKGNRFVAAPAGAWNSMGAIGGLAPAHFLDQVFEPGGRTDGSEVPLQSCTDGIADRSADLPVQGLI